MRRRLGSEKMGGSELASSGSGKGQIAGSREHVKETTEGEEVLGSVSML